MLNVIDEGLHMSAHLCIITNTDLVVSRLLDSSGVHTFDNIFASQYLLTHLAYLSAKLFFFDCSHFIGFVFLSFDLIVFMVAKRLSMCVLFCYYVVHCWCVCSLLVPIAKLLIL